MSAIMSHLSQLQAQDGSWSQEDVDIDVDAVSEGDLLEVIQQVHHVDYIEYLRDAYEMWVQDGGSKNAVMPETFPHPGLMASSKSKAMYAKNLSPLAKAGLYCFDLSCPITGDTFTSALAAVRVVLSALQYLVSESSAQASPGAFALTRPPGHHASPSVCGGYCFFNNAAIAARYLQSRVPNTKIAILDIDYHHGNGICNVACGLMIAQDVFYQDPSVLYISLHAEGDYPYFTGTSEEIGDGPGVGFNLNIPLAQYTTGNIEYIAALQKGLERISEFGSQWLLVSLGVDTYKHDPLCNFNLTTEGYHEIGREIGLLKLPTLFVMEGGYHIDTLGVNVGGVLLGFKTAV
ncbi:histone deacetylase family protein [Rhizoctonia solani]|uniref:Histone deacetylase family protein n=1 Tax=Rhizoctonia solani TaxID=456999 RepID=A0A8H8SXD2_9AGAM|nr:histone deacetylase family protein [Rhizoctonia solani]QRW21399.1 histone deacetylase family protein [Rhizoctonia solani]